MYSYHDRLRQLGCSLNIKPTFTEHSSAGYFSQYMVCIFKINITLNMRYKEATYSITHFAFS